jgi:plastocyanin
MSPFQPRQYRVVSRALLCLGVALLALTAPAGPPSTAAKPKTRTVVLRGMDYLPATVTVNVGDTVIWKNEDIVPHTATARNKSFDSGNIEPGGSWRYVANKKGTYPYYCAYHPNTKGRLVVR